MPEKAAVSLEAKSPFELRVHLGDDVPEQTVREALASGDMGFLHSFTTGSTVDGPGVRVVAWTTGCMWRCRYCHNPDTWTLTNGIPVSVARAAEELGKYRHGLKVMSGGFTLSGGEPLMQHRFAAKLLAAAKKMGIHTTIETNGYYGDKLSDADLETIDLVMLGIKTWDPGAPQGAYRHGHRSHTRVRAPAGGAPPADLDPLRAGAGAYRRHGGSGEDGGVRRRPRQRRARRGSAVPPDGRFKWDRLGLDYTLRGVEAPTAEAAEQACEVFRRVGLKAF